MKTSQTVGVYRGSVMVLCSCFHSRGEKSLDHEEATGLFLFIYFFGSNQSISFPTIFLSLNITLLANDKS